MLGLVLPLPASAAFASTTYFGCLKCVEADWNPTGIGQECMQVGDNETGDGTTCRETTGLPGGTLCQLSGNPCYNSVVNGGGSNGTSGGGGSTCAYDDNGYCAPWCAACSRV